MVVEKRFRIRDLVSSETMIEAKTCVELQTFMKWNYKPKRHNWQIQYLSPSPAIGWQPMTMIGFQREIRNERVARIRTRVRTMSS